MAQRRFSSALSIILSLAIAATLAVKLWPESKDVLRRIKLPQTEQPATPKPAPLSVAVVRLPPPPPPAKPPPAPKARPASVAVTPLKPTLPTRQPTLAPAPAPVPVKAMVTPLKPEPRPLPPEKPRPASVKIDKAIAAEGRTLLRLLEHGKGPTIEIAWPSHPADRERLFGYLVGCLGMRVALMDGEKGFYLASGLAGAVSEINLDRFSGFMRHPSGRRSAAETRLIASIRARHNNSVATPVRLFPRIVDAALLGGLNKVVGTAYGTARNIQARYQQDRHGLYISRIRVDGHAIVGKILLSKRRCANSGV
jgi:hypothetical protein